MGQVQFYNGQVLFVGGQVAMDPACCCGAGGSQVCTACGACCFSDASTITIADTATPLPSTGSCTWSLTEGADVYSVVFNGTPGTGAWTKTVNGTPTNYDGSCCGAGANIVLVNNKCCKCGTGCAQTTTAAGCDGNDENSCCRNYHFESFYTVSIVFSWGTVGPYTLPMVTNYVPDGRDYPCSFQHYDEDYWTNYPADPDCDQVGGGIYYICPDDAWTFNLNRSGVWLLDGPAFVTGHDPRGTFVDAVEILVAGNDCEGNPTLATVGDLGTLIVS